MFNNVALDVFIGLVFVFLLYSLLATILQEMISTKLAFRSKVLEKAVIRMLEDGKATTANGFWSRLKSFAHLLGKPNLLKDKTITPWFYAHPLIRYLGEDNFYSKPAYISPQNFSKVIVDLLKGFGKDDVNEVQTISDSINNGKIYKLPINLESDKKNPAVKALLFQQQDTVVSALETVDINMDTALFLRSLWLESNADLDTFKLKLEGWFNDTMDRCSGWYKRYNRVILFILGLIMAIFFNVDTIAIHSILAKDKTARDQLVQMAISRQQQYGSIIENLYDDTAKLRRVVAAQNNDTAINAIYQQLNNDANTANEVLGLGWGWSDTCKICKETLTKQYSLKLDSLKENVITIKTNKVLSAALNDSIKYYTDNAQKLKDKNEIEGAKNRILALQTQQKSIDASLQKLDSTSFAQYARMQSFTARCAYIQSERDKHWFKNSASQPGGLVTIIGWLITAVAICLGAPFWFDMLNKLISIRGVGTKVDTATGSGDDSKSSGNQPNNNNAPTIIVNPNPGEEAVG
ncbi:hypothetical protein QEG73_23835 [Chitinophagaceae bacterium 26-R-25]|nr:hypothetical protein [Chitinophagaceae bacterium 26-R-25]